MANQSHVPSLCPGLRVHSQSFRDPRLWGRHSPLDVACFSDRLVVLKFCMGELFLCLPSDPCLEKEVWAYILLRRSCPGKGQGHSDVTGKGQVTWPILRLTVL